MTHSDWKENDFAHLAAIDVIAGRCWSAYDAADSTTLCRRVAWLSGDGAVHLTEGVMTSDALSMRAIA